MHGGDQHAPAHEARHHGAQHEQRDRDQDLRQVGEGLRHQLARELQVEGAEREQYEEREHEERGRRGERSRGVAGEAHLAQPERETRPLGEAVEAQPAQGEPQQQAHGARDDEAREQDHGHREQARSDRGELLAEAGKGFLDHVGEDVFPHREPP